MALKASGKFMLALAGGSLVVACAPTAPRPDARLRVEPAYRMSVAPDRNYEGLFALGRYELGKGNALVAVDYFRRALAVKPGDVSALNALGVAYGSAGMIDESIAAFSDAIKADPTAGHLYSNLGFAQLKAGRLPDAEAALREATRLDPSNLKTRENVALLEAAKAQGPVLAKAEPAKAEAPNVGVQPTQASRAEAPGAQVPKTEPSTAETPRAEAPKPVAAPSQTAVSPRPHAATLVKVTPDVYELREVRTEAATPVLATPSAPASVTASIAPARGGDVKPAPRVEAGVQAATPAQRTVLAQPAPVPQPAPAGPSASLVQSAPAVQPGAAAAAPASRVAPVAVTAPAAQPVQATVPATVPQPAQGAIPAPLTQPAPTPLAAPLVASAPPGPPAAPVPSVTAAQASPPPAAKAAAPTASPPIASKAPASTVAAASEVRAAAPVAAAALPDGPAPAPAVVASSSAPAQPAPSARPVVPPRPSAVDVPSSASRMAPPPPKGPESGGIASASAKPAPTMATPAPAGDRKAPSNALPAGAVAKAEPPVVRLPETASARPLASSMKIVGLEVSNGVGTKGLARRTALGLQGVGYKADRVSDYWNFRQYSSKIQYRAGYGNQAKALQAALPGPVVLMPASNLPPNINLRLVVGRDLVGRRIIAWVESPEVVQAGVAAEWAQVAGQRIDLNAYAEAVTRLDAEDGWRWG